MATFDNNTLTMAVENTARATLVGEKDLEGISLAAEVSQTDFKNSDDYMYGFPIFSESYDSSSLENDEEDEDNYNHGNVKYNNDKRRSSVPKREERRQASEKHKRILLKQKEQVYKAEYAELKAEEASEKTSHLDKYFKMSEDDDELNEDDDKDEDRFNFKKLFVKFKGWKVHPKREHYDRIRRNNSKFKRKVRKLEFNELHQYKIQYIGKSLVTT